MKQLELKKIAASCANKITKNSFCRKPYKYLIVDNFLPDDIDRKSIILYYDSKDPRIENQVITNSLHSALCG